jgi:hypothetical protein
MRKYILLFVVILAPYLSYSIGCVDYCTKSYNQSVTNATNDYRSAASSATWDTFKNTGTAWAARFSAGMGGAGLAFSFIGFFDPYWEVLRAEKAYNQALENALNGFSTCVNGCS